MGALDETALRSQAVALRLQGKSRREIRQTLGVGNTRLDRWLRGTAPPAWTKRPRAKDALRARARILRAEGRSVPDISLELEVAKSTVFRWVADLPSPLAGSRAERQVQWSARGGAVVRRRADVSRQATKLQAGREIGALTDRELLLVGVALYWAEGAKDKAWDRRERVSLINSDPRLILTFLQWLELCGVRREDLTYRVSIHESADVAASERYWAAIVGIEPHQLARTTIKCASGSTTRRNTGADYRGCLVVDVRRSSDLYRRVEGWWCGIVVAASGPAALHGLG